MKPKSFTYLRPASIDEAVQRWRDGVRMRAFSLVGSRW